LYVQALQYSGNNKEFLFISTITPPNLNTMCKTQSGALSILWFTADGNVLRIDGKSISFQKNEMLCLTEFHHVEVLTLSAIRLIRFNRDFYCILEHDSEVSCKGILFFGAAHLPRFLMEDSSLDVFETVFRMFKLELANKDELQLEMLQMMLKRFLILCTRSLKQQDKLSQNSTTAMWTL